MDDNENFNRNILLDYYKDNFKSQINKYKHSISMVKRKGLNIEVINDNV